MLNTMLPTLGGLDIILHGFKLGRKFYMTAPFANMRGILTENERLESDSYTQLQ